MIEEVEKEQYVWFVIPQGLSWYPVVLGARVEEVCEHGEIEVRCQYPHVVFDKSELYSTKKQAKVAAVEVLQQKIERMKSRTIEMENAVERWEKRNVEMCVCAVCDVNELSLHPPCIEMV